MSLAPARPRTVLVGLIGEGVGPSLSPAMHELEGARHGMAYIYRTIDIPRTAATPEGLERLLGCAQELGYDGLNITHPAKQVVVPLLDDLSPAAAAVGAVNTVTLAGGRRTGHNTDVSGFGAAMDDALAGCAREAVVLVGAGGAGAAVAHALATRVGELTIADADPSRAAALAAATGGRAIALDRVAEALAHADGVVNATPMGMAAHPGAAVDAALLRPQAFVADIVYRPVETALVASARRRGCRVLTGLGMALHQAADAFEIFTHETADRRAMLADLEGLVAAEAAGENAHWAPMKGQER
ncbi:shikimate dehydrogenase [Demequina pelophila]|uniref:shikimate dehydrogenase n=1 Tax=Demequina pelophila TaxID=1638984 RepID=UPI0007834879|nr:shikimate dehydrogenase [Demequina pelophila]